jgi:hypothetical protein
VALCETKWQEAGQRGGRAAELENRSKALLSHENLPPLPRRRPVPPPWHAACNVWHTIPLSHIRRHAVVPYHTIAFSQQKVRAALRRASGQEPPFNYGFVVHSRRHNERPLLGVITLNGESLALSERLLKGLDGLPIWLFGHARITLGAGDTIDGADADKPKADERPLSSLVMHISTFDTTAGVTQHLVQVEALVKAETLVQPLLVLAPERPAAWPL